MLNSVVPLNRQMGSNGWQGPILPITRLTISAAPRPSPLSFSFFCRRELVWPDAQNEKYGPYREDKGDAFLVWAAHENDKYPTRIKDARSNYGVARTRYQQRGDIRAVERVQRKYDEAQRRFEAANQENKENSGDLEPETTPA